MMHMCSLWNEYFLINFREVVNLSQFLSWMQKQVEAKKAELELARAEAARVVVEAQGTAQRNQILNASITDNLIRYKQALAQEDCATNAKCTMIIGNATPIVNTK